MLLPTRHFALEFWEADCRLIEWNCVSLAHLGQLAEYYILFWVVCFQPLQLILMNLLHDFDRFVLARDLRLQ
jgi:hypothetical protein